jgi:predicted lipoprotein with Yx(FWY)xxD motif
MPDRGSAIGGVLAAVTAFALSACAPVDGGRPGTGRPGEGYGGSPAGHAAAKVAPAVEPSPDPAAATEPADLTERLIGKKVPRMGRVVTDEDGWLLYRSDNDSADPPASNCVDECARVWPPAYTDGNAVASGVDAALVGTITREDGTRQLTIDGWPVYRYAGDRRPGQWKGQAVNGVWFVVAPTGRPNKSCLPEGTPRPVAPPPAARPTGSPAGGGYSY